MKSKPCFFFGCNGGFFFYKIFFFFLKIYNFSVKINQKLFNIQKKKKKKQRTNLIDKMAFIVI